jgi:hypothetical protein
VILCARYVEEYNRKSRYSAMTRQYARDTALLIAASYIMDWGEAGMRAIRGGKVGGWMGASCDCQEQAVAVGCLSVRMQVPAATRSSSDIVLSAALP